MIIRMSSGEGWLGFKVLNVLREFKEFREFNE